MLNKKEKMDKFPENNPDLEICSWINFIFGVSQWDRKPNINNLNLFGKYCYRQYINFDKILEKYKMKNYDEKKKIQNINNKKMRIINFGQCPEVIFNKKIPEEYLYLPKSIMQSKEYGDDLDINEEVSYTMIKLGNKEVVTFWISENNNFIYFLISNLDNSYNILIYGIGAQKEKDPKYTINLNEINLFKPKGKVKLNKNFTKLTSKNLVRDIKNNDIEKNSLIEKFNNNESNASGNNANISHVNIKNNDSKLKERKITFEAIYSKDKTDNKDNKEKEMFKEQYYYKISPKYILFDICQDDIIYLFVGRNMDNSIKIYEQIIKNKCKSELKYNIFTDSFVSCLCKKDKNTFFSGHKNGKLYEWNIVYTDNLNIKKPNNLSSLYTVELKRDIIAHKESMICTINYIEKHNIIITASKDGNLCIRKYIDFELLSLFPKQNDNSIITKVIYTDYDLLYLLISQKYKDSIYNSKISIYTLNGLLIESSKMNNYIDIESLKNGKIICNNLYSRNLKIFGFNENIGEIEDDDILMNINDKEIHNAKIVNFIYQKNNALFYLYLSNGILYKRYNEEYKLLSKGAHKLKKNENCSNKNNTDFSLNTNEINNNQI